MKYEDTKKLINDVIQNELNHIQNFQERDDLLNNIEINTKSKNSDEALNKLYEIASEHKELIDKFECEFAGYWIEMCNYYFKKGVVAGATNLNFLKNTQIIGHI